jgi:hypothetical protein
VSARLRARCAALFALGILATPSLAQACAVCFTGRADEQRVAFLVTTIFMTFLPLILIGLGVTAFIRRVRRIEAEREAVAAAVRIEA